MKEGEKGRGGQGREGSSSFALRRKKKSVPMYRKTTIYQVS